MPYILLVLTTLFWSGNVVLSRGMHTEIPPISLAFWRWTLALAILIFFGMRHLIAQKELTLKNYKFLTTQGLLGVTGYNSLIYVALQTTTAINVALVTCCIPVIIVIISWIMYKDRLTLKQCLGVCISLGGVLWIISGGTATTLLQLQYNRGDILVFIAAILWALYSANLKRYPKGLHPLAYQTAIVIVGLTALTPFYVMELYSGKTMAINPATVVTVFYVAIFASVLAFIFWNRAVTELGANVAGPFIHLMPVFSTVLAVIFLGETITSTQFQAILLIFAGILLATRKKKSIDKHCDVQVHSDK